MVGFKDSLLVQVKPKDLNYLTTLIFHPSIVIFIRGIVTCEQKICATVLLTFIGCFHFRAYSKIRLHILVPSLSRYSIVGAKFFNIGGRMSTLRSSAKILHNFLSH